ncbi:MAG: hybrid sensor histidine kinase/response regulator [Spirirestis rafaelensis WJT71-NPBG6]|jgi:chemosensory pili system protein ChpA (sensor histidine kinase/response regulator)|nr:hybrid sensor histidine kinase/response regulator [Spirirestis rafaelensis WJT71-NPBG6]
MSKDKELEIQMQFLEEATDYLNTLEEVLLEISATNRIELDKINAALRAAHSIKGGAGMMGFRALSDLAHRLEDSFKVLRTRKNSLEIDTQLQSLLLSSVDWLRQIVELLSEGNVVKDDWLATFCYPVFQELHDRLGDPTPEDASTILSTDEGQDIIPLLFETEVEGCLQRLESVLADSQQPCLREEVAIMAAELGGLGEMLQLPAFTQLCQSITYHISATVTDTQVEQIARLALQAWRRSQTLVLTNQRDSLPTDIEVETIARPDYAQIDLISTQEAIAQFLASNEVQSDDLEAQEAIAQFLATNEVQSQAQIVEPNLLEIEDTEEAWLNPEIIAASFESLDTEIIDDNATVDDPPRVEVYKEISNTDYKFVERKPESIGVGKDREVHENTVRVPSKQLEQINDLFGELIIQRNGLNLQMERLRKLIRNLSQRVQILDRENQELRTAYDKITTHAGAQSNSSSLTFVDNNNSDNFAFDDSEYSPQLERGFDALEMDRYNKLSLLSQEVMESIVQVQQVTTDIQLSVDDTDQFARKLNKTSKHLQTKLTQIWMRPLSDLLDRFPRALRDMNVEYGKNVQLKIEGGNTLIERSILKALNDPLMHLLRNAFDHGIEDPATRRAAGKPEQAVIEIKATHRSNRTIITMRDDGRGMSLDKIRARAAAMGLDATLLAQATDEELLSLIFEPGFSTSDQVTILSGRGVGMDVVRNNLKQIRGDVKVDTVAGVGTTITMSVPFTLFVARVLLVESNRMLLAFPTDVVLEIFLLQNDQVFPMADTEVINWQGTMLPLVRLGQHLEFNCPRYNSPDLETAPAINAANVLIIKGNNQPAAVQIDRCWGEQEVAIRQIEGNIPLPNGFSNCTILGDGRVVALVNANELLYWIATNKRTPKTNQLPSAKLKTAFLVPNDDKVILPQPDNQKGTILIVDDSINVRRFLALTLEKGGYQVEQAKDGQDALEKLNSGLQVQAVICDIEMPRIDGYGFLGRVKSNNDIKNIPIAMLTSRSSDKHRQLALQLGARAYFSKPYNEQELLRTLEQIIFPMAEAASSN